MARVIYLKPLLWRKFLPVCEIVCIVTQLYKNICQCNISGTQNGALIVASPLNYPNIWNKYVKSAKRELLQTFKNPPLLHFSWTMHMELAGRQTGAKRRVHLLISLLHHTCSCPVPVALGTWWSLVTFIRVRNVLSIQDLTRSLENSTAQRNIKCTEHWIFCLKCTARACFIFLSFINQRPTFTSVLWSLLRNSCLGFSFYGLKKEYQ